MKTNNSKKTRKIKTLRRKIKKSNNYLKITVALFVSILIASSAIVFFIVDDSPEENNKNNNNNNNNNGTSTDKTDTENSSNANSVNLNENKHTQFRFDEFIKVYQVHIIDKVNSSKQIVKENLHNIFGMNLQGIDDLMQLDVLMNMFSLDSDIKDVKVEDKDCINNTNRGQKEYCVVYPQIISAYAIASTCYRFLTNNFIHFDISTKSEDDDIKVLSVNYMIVHNLIYKFAVKFVDYFNRTEYLKSKLETVINNSNSMQKLARNSLEAFEEVSKELFVENELQNNTFRGTLIIRNLKIVRKFLQLILFQMNLYLFRIDNEVGSSKIVFSKDFNRIIAMIRNNSVNELINNEGYKNVIEELSEKSGEIYNLFEDSKTNAEYKWEIGNDGFVKMFDEFITSLILNGGDF